MEEILAKLREAAEIKGAIAQQESAVWLKIISALKSPDTKYAAERSNCIKGVPGPSCGKGFSGLH